MAKRNNHWYIAIMLKPNWYTGTSAIYIAADVPVPVLKHSGTLLVQCTS